MDLAKYLSMLNQRCLFFAKASLLGDPFEGSATKLMVAQREYIKNNRTTDPALADWKNVPDHFFDQMSGITRNAVDDNLLNCWHMNEHESAAMWKLYSSSDEAVCIQSTYRRLRLCLPSSVLIGEVDYINYNTDEFATHNVFNFIMHKRVSFSHERELRAVFWDVYRVAAQNPGSENDPKLVEARRYRAKMGPTGLPLEVDLTALIEHVYVSPAAAPWFVSLVTDMTAKCGFAFPVSQSELAASPLF